MMIINIDYHNSSTNVLSFSRHSGASGINGLCSFMGILNNLDMKTTKGDFHND